MPRTAKVRVTVAPRLRGALIVFYILLALVLLAGGGSRSDLLGQVVVRGAAFLALIGWVLIGERPKGERGMVPAMLLGTFAAIVAVQIIPLPPALWMLTPGHDLIAEAQVVAGRAGAWHSLALVPDGAINALFALVVPVAVLVGLMIVPEEFVRTRLLQLVLIGITISAIVGLLQVSGTTFDHPLLNDDATRASGLFANRNHQSLFLCLGLALLPSWALGRGARQLWRLLLAAGLALLLMLTILATGSRAGLVLAALALAFGTLASWGELVRLVRLLPPKVKLGAAIAGVVIVVALIAVSVQARRAEAIERLFELDAGDDMRSRALPVVLQMLRDNLIIGSGFGSFETLFRVREPFALLKPTYFNHAHSDVLEFVIEGGVPATILALAAIIWVLRRAIPAWLDIGNEDTALTRVGFACLVVIVAASCVDYPMRTPLMMSVAVIAVFWVGLRPLKADAAAGHRFTARTGASIDRG